ncbi:NAD-dependent protein deacylase [Bacillus pacificus]|uniref:NAD-dependent protein deacylase n=1 Tax=Bacillus TaxID=1386 RepID=UPI0009452521|nr:NAD-dependent protein deacylase [Bacillus pacificus]MCC2417329.1 NAD-dependent protein deacylase [Bacillus pacificus]MCC2474399.1 NAD-dependent protein deacylase [Bacillus pacificus]MCU5006554.1 NAD-dependent protein deacylase [Bacillus pacificus]MCU5257001.1 NAD-dependent protein deacylase [Bacillus pacificus]MCU5558949.1 NAD-dependent protein deacylase [Bacillus pacificus]
MIFVQQFEEVRSILEKAKKITVLTGAGASTESGIPDFRSANGLYADANVEMYLSRGYYNRSPKEFWKHYKEIFQINTFYQYKPNRGHRFLAELEEQGKDITILTQNIDGLHQLGGSKHVIDLHGTLQTAHCPKCKAGYDLQYMIDHEVPRCEKCNFILNPDVVLYGDTLPQYQNAIKRLYETDVLIVMGTSLKVQPVASFPQIAKREVGATTILVNEELTGQEYNFDYVFQNKIGEFVEGLSSRK